MKWDVEIIVEAEAEYEVLADDQKAHFQRIVALIREHGLERVRFPHVRHIDGPLWEIRLKGRSGIARGLYVTCVGKRVLVVRIFVKKTEKTPRSEIELALNRAERFE